MYLIDETTLQWYNPCGVVFMNGIIETNGIIIKVMPIGEYDKRITILTKERGKISAFARGARRVGNQFMGVTRAFACGKFNLYGGRDSMSLHSAHIENYFEDLAEDMEKTCYGTYFLELADYYARENMSEPQMIKLLYYALTALTKPALPHKLVRRIYELKLMVIEGEYDEKPRDGVSETTAYTWEYIRTSPVEKLFNFVVNEETQEELGKEIDHMMNRYINHPMNSLEILKMM